MNGMATPRGVWLEHENCLLKSTARCRVACNGLFFIGWRNVVPPARVRIDLKMVKLIYGAVLLGAGLGLISAMAADPANGPAGTDAPGRKPAPSMSPEDMAEIATLNDFPPYKSGLGDGNYSIGPRYAPAPEETIRENVPHGKVIKFTMDSAESKFYTGGAKPFKRTVTVYVPSQYIPGKPAPIIVSADAYGGRRLATVLDNMIADHRLHVMVAVMIMPGGGERAMEYDTVSSKYADFVEEEVLPRAEKEAGFKATKDPDARMTYGGSSGGAVSFTMAWFHPELYHRVLTNSGTYVNNIKGGPDAPHSAWEYHEHFIPNNPPKPLRIWMEVSERDLDAKSPSSRMHNWVIANIRMAKALKAKGYHYQFVYAKGAGHTDGKVMAQTLPQALEYLWTGYPIDLKP